MLENEIEIDGFFGKFLPKKQLKKLLIKEFKEWLMNLFKQNVEKDADQSVSDYGLEINFAMIFTVFIFNIILIVKIKYGDYAITHITTGPYNFILVLLFVMMFEVLAWIINSTYYP